MLPGINPKQMQKAMRKLGIKQEDIPAQEVIIKCPDKNIIISNPQVTKVNMAGQETFQILGDISEDSGILEGDIKTVMEQTNCTEKQAKNALKENNGDLAAAILSLKSQ